MSDRLMTDLMVFDPLGISRKGNDDWAACGVRDGFAFYGYGESFEAACVDLLESLKLKKNGDAQ